MLRLPLHGHGLT
jgi:hypothetical protein